MNMSRLACICVVVLLLIPSVWAAEDLTGTWSGTFITTMDENPPRDDVAYLVLKQTGAELTGTAGPTADQQRPIAKGTVATVNVNGKDTTKAAFDLTTPDDTVAHFDLSTSLFASASSVGLENTVKVVALRGEERISRVVPHRGRPLEVLADRPTTGPTRRAIICLCEILLVGGHWKQERCSRRLRIINVRSLVVRRNL